MAFSLFGFNRKKQQSPKVQNTPSDNLSPEAREDLMLERKSMRYMEYTSTKDKAAHMCEDEIEKLQEYLNVLKATEKSALNAGDAFYRSTKEKEKSWALHGGIASGIAGGAAGLATAIRVQGENREIRERNQALAKGIAQVQINAITRNMEAARKVEEEIAFWKHQKILAQNKKTAELPVAQLLKELHISVVSTKFSAGGSAVLQVRLDPTKNLFIGNSPAVVDGTVKLVLRRNGVSVGEAILSLPHDGSESVHEELVTICRNPTEKYYNYEVEIEPYHLWAVESLNTYRYDWGNKDAAGARANAKEQVYACLKKRGGTETLPILTNVVASRCPELKLEYSAKSSEEVVLHHLTELEKEGRIITLIHNHTTYYRIKE